MPHKLCIMFFKIIITTLFKYSIILSEFVMRLRYCIIYLCIFFLHVCQKIYIELDKWSELNTVSKMTIFATINLELSLGTIPPANNFLKSENLY